MYLDQMATSNMIPELSCQFAENSEPQEILLVIKHILQMPHPRGHTPWPHDLDAPLPLLRGNAHRTSSGLFAPPPTELNVPTPTQMPSKDTKFHQNTIFNINFVLEMIICVMTMLAVLGYLP